jgi:hypothetical protein
MQILSKGYKLPETGDFGDVWFPALEDNITRLNGHTHDGVNSEQISGQNMLASVVTALVGSFVDQGNGYWKATIGSPSGLLVDNFSITFRDPTTKEAMHPKFEKASAATVDIYLNTPQTIEALFGV